MVSTEDRIEIEGRYKKTIMRDLRDGYTSFILEVQNENKRKKYYCSGNILPIEEGEHIIVQGKWEIDQLYGPQIKDVIIKRPPMDKNGLLKLILSSGLGLGTATARNIVENFGEQLIQNSLDEELENRMVLLRGITRKQCQQILNRLRNQNNQQELYEYLVRHGGVYKDYLILYRKYGFDALEMLRKKPYEIGLKNGLRFIVCDSIAKESGGHSQSAIRLENGIRRALHAAASEGHTYLEKPQLLKETQRLLRNAVFPDPVSVPAICLGIELATRSGVVREENRFYLDFLRNAEKRVAENIGNMSFPSVRYEEYQTALIDQVMEKTGIQFANGQRDAFTLLESSGVKVLLGGPGTGKSATRFTVKQTKR